MNFTHLVESLLRENNVAGGAESAFGPGVTKTATAQSGDNYATKDSRMPKSLYGTTLSRFGTVGGPPKSRKKKRNKRASKSNKKAKQWI